MVQDISRARGLAIGSRVIRVLSDLAAVWGVNVYDATDMA